MEQIMSNLFLAIDYSSTGPKFLCGHNTDELFSASIPPQIVSDVTESMIKSSQCADGTDYSVIRLGEQIYMTGQAASNFSNGAVYLKETKINKAIPQTLSAIAYAAQELNLGNKITLEIKCLLPAGEIGDDRSRLGQDIIEAAKSFGTLRNKYRCKVQSFICQPEGAGLLRKFSALRKMPVTDLSVGILSLGYRNAGFFSVIKGQPGHYRSPRLGFSTLIERFRSTVGGLDGEDITKGLSRYLETGDRANLSYIARFGKDVDEIATKAEEARDSYCRDLKQDIKEHIPNVDEIVIGGGSAQTLRKYLQSCVVQDVVYFHAGLGKAWDYPEQLKAKLKDDLYYRFADLYCFC
jgi:hypothetical protein